MKTKYLKRILAVSFSATVLLFSSCLKDDTRYFDAETVPNLAELPNSGTSAKYFGFQAITDAGVTGSTAKGTVTFAVGVTSATLPTTATTVTIAFDNSIIATYNTTFTKTYIAVPAGAATLASTTVTIPAGQNSVLTTMVVDGTLLDKTKNYMIPVKIVSAGSLPISSNYGIDYFHIR